MPLRILVFQHHSTSPAGLVGERMAARGAMVTTLDAQAGVAIPQDAGSHDGIVILGGAVSAYADDRCPHFPALLDLARRFADERRPVLGICLGAQLLARAWGAAVHLGGAHEFGLVPLRPTPAADADPLLAGMGGPVWAMQWHDDTFDLPRGATLLLTGETCRHQAFRVAEIVHGFQCHFETDRAAMLAWARLRHELYGLPDLTRAITAQVETVGAAAEMFGRRIADRWLDLVAAQRAARLGRQHGVGETENARVAEEIG
ncbi:type 1 glutamine amidotransferase [Benzoatithermus flavus]|uniref:Type 1 glutamine amidotransferase n=1 Tax=Benzoatithermus flavus TaxID=3108223 RepID=A0ABU8XRN6_9PROT